MRCWLKTYCSISHPSLKVVQNCTWIWVVDETIITQWTRRRRKRRRRRKDLNNFLYILHVNDLWELAVTSGLCHMQINKLCCETKWVKELKSDPPPTRGFENKFNLIHRRTKSKGKWTQGKEKQFFSIFGRWRATKNKICEGRNIYCKTFTTMTTKNESQIITLVETHFITT
jgi:hypothetical protein